MIRILQTGFTANYGGVEAVVMNWYRNIDRRKIQFDFLVSHKLNKIAYEDEIVSLGGHIYREYYGRKEKPFTASKYIEKIFENDSEIQGVHMNLNTLEYITPLLVAKKRKLPILIAHAHNSNNLNEKVRFETKTMQIINKAILQSKDYKKIGCSSLAIEYMFGKSDNAAVLRNAIDLNKFQFSVETREKIRTELCLDPETVVIGYIGRLQYQKNPIYMLKVFECYRKINPNSRLVIVGTGDMEAECKAYVETHQLNNHVCFCGMRSDVERFYSAFDLFLFPSLFEGLGVVLIEAQACELPCLISDIIPKEVNITPLVVRQSLDDSPERWAAQVDKIVNAGNNYRLNRDLSLRTLISDAGYSIENEAKILERTYIKLVGEKR